MAKLTGRQTGRMKQSNKENKDKHNTGERKPGIRQVMIYCWYIVDDETLIK